MLEIAERELNRISVVLGYTPVGRRPSFVPSRSRVWVRVAGYASAVATRTEVHPLRERYSQNDPLHPVLKHGPRSLTYVRVLGWQTLVRNESEGPNPPEVGTVRCTIDRS